MPEYVGNCTSQNQKPTDKNNLPIFAPMSKQRLSGQEQALKLQTIFCRNVCNGYKQYCKDNGMQHTKLLKLNGHTTTYSYVDNVARGKFTFMSCIALFNVTQSAGLQSPTQLEQYWINHPNNPDNIPK